MKLKPSIMQPFHPVFRHLWYLSLLLMVGLVVSGFAYEKLSGDTSRLAILGFTSAIVHGAAWWFTVGVTSPLKKSAACGLLFVGAMLAAAVGRCAYLSIAEQPFGPLLANMQFIASVIPIWFLTLAIITGVAKEFLRWRLNYKETPISPRTSLADMFQLTAIIGVLLAFGSASISSLLGTAYATILLVSIGLHVVVLIPLSMLVWNRQRQSFPQAVLFGTFVVGFGVLGLLMFARSYLGDEFGGVSDVAVGFSAFVVPYVLMLLLGREKGLSVTSGWSKEPVTIEIPVGRHQG